MSNKPIIYTIGHSTRPIDEFINLLKINSIKTLIDIRSFPGSRHVPQYNQEEFRFSLNENEIDYLWLPQLGGKRKSFSGNISEVAWWENKSFSRYASYAINNLEFQDGLLTLKEFSPHAAIMCAEAQWWKCHRRIVSDWLIANNCSVFHIMSKNSLVEHTISAGAEINYSNGIYNVVAYPSLEKPPEKQQLELPF